MCSGKLSKKVIASEKFREQNVKCIRDKTTLKDSVPATSRFVFQQNYQMDNGKVVRDSYGTTDLLFSIIYTVQMGSDIGPRLATAFISAHCVVCLVSEETNSSRLMLNDIIFHHKN
jgi:lysyl-tRNA synthetase class I